MAQLKIGDQAPAFRLKNQDNKDVSLADFQGKKHVVLYFYPKDESTGCVMEACSFRDSYEAFLEAGAEVIGVSADSVRSHKSFQENRRLPFILLSDRDNAVRKAYGVKGTMLDLIPGRETFVIDKNGLIKHRFASQIQIDSHIKEALKVLEELD